MIRIALGICVGVLLVTLQARARPPIPAPVKQGFLCIHSHEGSWTDTGAPHWGGLQMDYSFMSTYGTWLLRNRGTADRWTPRQQLVVAYRAYKGWKGYSGRGFYPWPNTARMCGLI